MATPPNIHAIVFDLGGVLIQLGEPLIKKEWCTTESNLDITGDAWLLSSTAQDFEKGLIAPLEFAENIISELSLTLPRPSLLHTLSNGPLALTRVSLIPLASCVIISHWLFFQTPMPVAGRKGRPLFRITSDALSQTQPRSLYLYGQCYGA